VTPGGHERALAFLDELIALSDARGREIDAPRRPGGRGTRIGGDGPREGTTRETSAAASTATKHGAVTAAPLVRAPDAAVGC
jgi:hypothetical protein